MIVAHASAPGGSWLWSFMSVARRPTLMQQHGGSRSLAATRRASVREYILQMTSTDDVTSIKSIPSSGAPSEQSFHERVNGRRVLSGSRWQNGHSVNIKFGNDRLQTLIINNLHTLGS